VSPADFISSDELVVSKRQYRAFFAHWPALDASEQSQICTILETAHG
jgi:hypothetical protein